jgi:hypothetical protein
VIESAREVRTGWSRWAAGDYGWRAIASRRIVAWQMFGTGPHDPGTDVVTGPATAVLIGQ